MDTPVHVAVCAHCGKENPPACSFCSDCGKLIPVGNIKLASGVHHNKIPEPSAEHEYRNTLLGWVLIATLILLVALAILVGYWKSRQNPTTSEMLSTSQRPTEPSPESVAHKAPATDPSADKQEQEKLAREAARRAESARKQELQKLAREAADRAETARRQEHDRLVREAAERTEVVRKQEQERLAREAHSFHVILRNQTGTYLNLAVTENQAVQKRLVAPGDTAAFDFEERPRALSFRADITGGEGDFWTKKIDTQSPTNRYAETLVLRKDQFVLQILNATDEIISTVEIGGKRILVNLPPNKSSSYVVGAFTIPANSWIRIYESKKSWLYQPLDYKTDPRDGYTYTSLEVK
jgi:hypothetical protein